MSEPVRVTVAIGQFDDLLLRGLRGLIEDDASLELLGCGLTRTHLTALLRSRRPRVAILDHGSLTSPAEIRELVAAHPATHLVLIAAQLSTAECTQLLAFGAAACLSRSTQARDVLNAVHLASRGLHVSPRRFDGPPPELDALTPRESDVLAELQRRRANAQIASDLHISIETVRTHARNIYRKLGVSSRRELLAPRDAGPAAADDGGPAAP